MRARPLVVVLVGLLLALCGAASSQAADASSSPASGAGSVSGSVSGGSLSGGAVSAPAQVSAPAPMSAPAPVSASGPEADAPSHTTAPTHTTATATAHTVRDQADDGSVDPGPARCHKSDGDGQGTLPSAPSGSSQQSLPFVLAACLLPESHSALDAAHARPPVRGPAPAPPLTPVELSVLRV